MRISKKRINSAERYLGAFSDNDLIIVGISAAIDNEKLRSCGFQIPLNEGDTVLPAKLGTISTFNVDGSYVKLKNLPKEWKYRDGYVIDWHGNGHYVDIPYQRFQREIIEAPELYLSVKKNSLGELMITTKAFQKSELIQIKHGINLFLELFGEANILNESMAPALSSEKVKRLNWSVLPKGNYPWDKLESAITNVTQRLSANTQKVVKSRLKKINDHNPDFIAVGSGGFNGYVIFGFEKKDIYILESSYTGNATYVFGTNWEELSQMTKSEILNGQFELERIIHRSNWPVKIASLLRQ